MARSVLALLILALLFSGLSFSATCAEKSYSASCSKCSFNNDTGQMDPKCYQSFQDKGVSCLFTAYPLQSIEYKMGNCPGIDTCVERLNTCKALYSTGNDREDCYSESINHCFIEGDICVAAATKDCSKPPPEQIGFDVPPAGWCDGFWFMILPIFVGIFYVRRG